MNNQELQSLVESISLEFFKCPFLHKAYFNSRLKSTGGRYFLKNHNIDINPKMLEEFNEQILIGVIKHELCHYHLHLSGQKHTHRDLVFRNLLQQVGGLRYAPRISNEKMKYQYVCQQCERKFWRQRKMNPDRYRCGACHGKIKLI
ncbi:hypothetical protein FC40_GL000965 [Ligilactobacillus hayakitensis DSM 18933 = JCM 14209]|uniref:Protein SprT-like n=1 Tax=Ligilactobacillus hayakitensis DSM 18933 = JCM 14209 TaxID=1423755 RepID=A0A0R1WKA6_9LACO|nr:SprT family protein [Ligilactobacillus hayakitensis]KRM18286.1 hypothetical protein FC40_GL000965 [Ligilactobacillus hayakitensis DSM 18933 = JCM 14209]